MEPKKFRDKSSHHSRNFQHKNIIVRISLKKPGPKGGGIKYSGYSKSYTMAGITGRPIEEHHKVHLWMIDQTSFRSIIVYNNSLVIGKKQKERKETIDHFNFFKLGSCRYQSLIFIPIDYSLVFKQQHDLNLQSSTSDLFVRKNFYVEEISNAQEIQKIKKIESDFFSN